MTFLDDVDSLKAKVGIGSTSPLVLLGLSARDYCRGAIDWLYGLGEFYFIWNCG